MINSISLKLPCKQSNIDIVLSTINAFLSTSDLFEEYNLDIDQNTVMAVKTAVTEAIQNCIDHAYPNYTGLVRVTMKICDRYNRPEPDKYRHKLDLIITIKDYGIGIENIDEAMEPFYTTKSDTNSGMGFTVMNGYVDEVYVNNIKGTEVKLILHLN